MFEEKVLDLLKFAKRAVAVTNEKTYDWHHIIIAAIHTGVLDNQITELFGIEDKIQWPEETAAKASELEKAGEPLGKVSPTLELRKLFNDLRRASANGRIELTDLAKPLFDLADESWKLEFMDLNKISKLPDTSLAVGEEKENKHLRSIQELQTNLQKEIIGQGPIVDILCETLITFCCRRREAGKLRGSLFLSGLSGSGKTKAIELISAWVKADTTSFGINSSYIVNGGNLSVDYLANVLHKKGPALLIVDGIDKAHPATLALLARILDSPRVELTKTEVADISGWIVLYSANTGNRIEQNLHVTDKTLLPSSFTIRNELLEEYNVSAVGESPKREFYETILEKAETFVPFRRLDMGALAEVMTKSFDSLAADLKESNSIDLTFDSLMSDLMTLIGGYKCHIDGREAAARFAQKIEGPVRLAAINNQGCAGIHLSCEDQRFYQSLPREKPKVLIIDDESFLPGSAGVVDRYQRILGDLCSVYGAVDLESALELAEEKKIDLLLLDMWFHGEEKWQNYLEGWRGIYPETSVVLFSSEPCSPSRLQDIRRLGGVLGFLSKNLSDEESHSQLVSHYLTPTLWAARVRSFNAEYGCAGERLEVQMQTKADGEHVKLLYDHVNLVLDDVRERGEEPVMVPETRQELESFLNLFLNPVNATKLGIKQPRGLLLCGPPGTGKTMIARWLAGRMNCSFITLSAGDFQSPYMGIASNRVTETFNKARAKSPCVIFIDEIESVVPQRSSGGPPSGAVSDKNATVTTFLAEMDGFSSGGGVFLIGATNHKESIDPAVLRPGRLDRHVFVDLPGKNERRELLSRTLGNRKHSIDLEWAVEATINCSGADIVQAINDAALLAADRRGQSAEQELQITPDDISEAIDRLKFGARRDREVSTQETRDQLKRTAWHEAGHAVAMYLLFNDPPPRLTIVSRGQYGGYASLSEDVLNKLAMPDESVCRSQLMVFLAGGVAETIEFKSHSAGVESDHQRAIHLARDMVGKWGMAGIAAQIPFILGAEQGGDIAESVAKILQEAHDDVTKLLNAQRMSLAVLAAELQDKEELSGSQIEEIIKSHRVSG